MLTLWLDASMWVQSRWVGEVLEWKPGERIRDAEYGFRVIRMGWLG